MGEINGEFGELGSVPIHYMYRSVPPEELAALYRLADVAMVTPLRDGMNLVAKEYIASRSDDSGVLVLGEFAGAASELGEALVVNTWDITERCGRWSGRWRWARMNRDGACRRCADGSPATTPGAGRAASSRAGAFRGQQRAYRGADSG